MKIRSRQKPLCIFDDVQAERTVIHDHDAGYLCWSRKSEVIGTRVFFGVREWELVPEKTWVPFNGTIAINHGVLLLPPNVRIAKISNDGVIYFEEQR